MPASNSPNKPGGGSTTPPQIPVTILQVQGTVNSGDPAVLKYPEDMSAGKNTDYVAFSFFDYNPPFGKGQGQDADQNGTANPQPGYNLYNRNADKTNLTPATGLKSILMYMPQDLQGQYGANWGGVGFGAGFSGLARFIGGEMDAVAGVDAAPGQIKIAGYKTAVENLNKALGSSVTTNQLMGGVSGTIINPNVEMMYEAPEMRGLSLSFKMVARRLDESKKIREICQTFKKAMLPSYSGQTVGGITISGALITVPKICKITFMTGPTANEWVTQYKPCAITNVSVNHTADGVWAAYEGGAPVATDLQITFKETKLIFADEITDGASF